MLSNPAAPHVAQTPWWRPISVAGRTPAAGSRINMCARLEARLGLSRWSSRPRAPALHKHDPLFLQFSHRLRITCYVRDPVILQKSRFAEHVVVVVRLRFLPAEEPRIAALKVSSSTMRRRPMCVVWQWDMAVVNFPMSSLRRRNCFLVLAFVVFLPFCAFVLFSVPGI